MLAAESKVATPLLSKPWRSIATSGAKATEGEHRGRRLEPATRQTKEVIDRGVAGEHVGGPTLDGPADPGVWKGTLQGYRHRHAVEDVSDGRQFDDDDRARAGHAITTRARWERIASIPRRNKASFAYLPVSFS
jgi:hypothetical protein